MYENPALFGLPATPEKIARRPNWLPFVAIIAILLNKFVRNQTLPVQEKIL